MSSQYSEKTSLITCTGVVGATGCFAADGVAFAACKTGSAGLGTPLCLASGAGITTLFGVLAGTAMAVSMAQVGRAVGCKAFSGECIPL
mmetsp:Transcript_9692/g.21069  ORF Transcript_9692/g.21069 Transcript_9692/m.21069 type:complete len:89 (-) Transcript_9692:69-335(-)